MSTYNILNPMNETKKKKKSRMIIDPQTVEITHDMK